MLLPQRPVLARTCCYECPVLAWAKLLQASGPDRVGYPVCCYQDGELQVEEPERGQILEFDMRPQAGSCPKKSAMKCPSPMIKLTVPAYALAEMPGTDSYCDALGCTPATRCPVLTLRLVLSAVRARDGSGSARARSTGRAGTSPRTCYAFRNVQY
eukprot:3768766-Rhodomonas_salina.3